MPRMNHQTKTPIMVNNISLYIDPPYGMVQHNWDNPKANNRSNPIPKAIDGLELKRAINGVFTEAVWNPTLENTVKIDHAEIKMEQENYNEPLNILGEFSRMFMRMKPNVLQPVLVGHIFVDGFFDPLTQQFFILRFIALSEKENWKKILL